MAISAAYFGAVGRLFGDALQDPYTMSRWVLGLPAPLTDFKDFTTTSLHDLPEDCPPSPVSV
jgi:hypothetical protein